MMAMAPVLATRAFRSCPTMLAMSALVMRTTGPRSPARAHAESSRTRLNCESAAAHRRLWQIESIQPEVARKLLATRPGKLPSTDPASSGVVQHLAQSCREIAPRAGILQRPGQHRQNQMAQAGQTFGKLRDRKWLSVAASKMSNTLVEVGQQFAKLCQLWPTRANSGQWPNIDSRGN